MTKYVGKYNVSYCGKSYDKKVEFEMVIISEFDESDGKCKEVARKTFYFLRGKGLVVPEFKTEKEVEEIFLKYKNNERIKAFKKIVSCKI